MKNKLSSRPQNRPGTINNISTNHDIIRGLEGEIARRLIMSHSKIFVDEILEKVDLIIEHATEMGIDIARCKFDHRVKTNLYKARSERG